jgi:anti-anti-sigma factor
MSLEFSSDASDQGVLTVRPRGRLDSDSASYFDSELSGCLDAGIEVLVFDLSGLEYLSSAGIRSLFTARMTMEQRGGNLFLQAPQPAVRKVLDMVRIVEPSNILDTAEELERLLD